jgi:hypothetical protein
MIQRVKTRTASAAAMKTRDCVRLLPIYGVCTVAPTPIFHGFAARNCARTYVAFAHYAHETALFMR